MIPADAITRAEFERAAELAGRDDPYSRRWAAAHERIAEAAAQERRG